MLFRSDLRVRVEIQLYAQSAWVAATPSRAMFGIEPEFVHNPVCARWVFVSQLALGVVVVTVAGIVQEALCPRCDALPARERWMLHGSSLLRK